MTIMTVQKKVYKHKKEILIKHINSYKIGFLEQK
jgi:hypothetical protein